MDADRRPAGHQDRQRRQPAEQIDQHLTDTVEVLEVVQHQQRVVTDPSTDGLRVDR
jgi:hypothetical protein